MCDGLLARSAQGLQLPQEPSLPLHARLALGEHTAGGGAEHTGPHQPLPERGALVQVQVVSSDQLLHVLPGQHVLGLEDAPGVLPPRVQHLGGSTGMGTGTVCMGGDSALELHRSLAPVPLGGRPGRLQHWRGGGVAVGHVGASGASGQQAHGVGRVRREQLSLPIPLTVPVPHPFTLPLAVPVLIRHPSTCSGPFREVSHHLLCAPDVLLHTHHGRLLLPHHQTQLHQLLLLLHVRLHQVGGDAAQRRHLRLHLCLHLHLRTHSHVLLVGLNRQVRHSLRLHLCLRDGQLALQRVHLQLQRPHSPPLLAALPLVQYRQPLQLRGLLVRRGASSPQLRACRLQLQVQRDGSRVHCPQLRGCALTGHPLVSVRSALHLKTPRRYPLHLRAGLSGR
mmetsp:Transcript_22217/g.49425  ORF Transcript_22217/g.49425 Transcript_22217/m.49425 type:complete len:394 (-) Transcript_22217:309-1490(-)